MNGNANVSKRGHDDHAPQAQLPPTVECIMCLRHYDRKDTRRYEPLGVFEKYCMCSICVYGQEENPR